MPLVFNTIVGWASAAGGEWVLLLSETQALESPRLHSGPNKEESAQLQEHVWGERIQDYRILGREWGFWSGIQDTSLLMANEAWVCEPLCQSASE